MSEERRQILKMVAEGKISPAEAEQLLDAVARTGPEADATQPADVKAKPKFLRILVEESDGDRVNIRVPLSLLRAGVKFGSLLPDQAREKVSGALEAKGIHLDMANAADAVEDLIQQLGELSIDVDEGDGDKVRIFCQ